MVRANTIYMTKNGKSCLPNELGLAGYRKILEMLFLGRNMIDHYRQNIKSMANVCVR